MTIPAWQAFAQISATLRKEREDYAAGKISEAEMNRLQPWRAAYKDFDVKAWDRMMAHEKRMQRKREARR